MKHAQKPDHVTLGTLLQRIREGQFVIPDFQREFEWKPSDIRALMSSIFQDYFIGSLLLWRGSKENFDSLSVEPIYAHSGGGSPVQIVLDGQQRLTALNYAFHAPGCPPPSRSHRFVFSVFVDRFMSEDFDDAFEQAWGENWCETILSDTEFQYSTHRFPLAVMGKGGFEIYKWAEGYTKYWFDRADQDSLASAHADNGYKFIEHVRELIEQYQISFVELDRDLPVDKVCDIFTQINSRGVKLDAFDLINALLKPKGIQLKSLYRSIAERLSFADTDRMNIYVLQVMSLLLQEYCSPKYLYYLVPGTHRTFRNVDGTTRTEILIESKEDFEQRWDGAVKALEKAQALLSHPQEFGVTAPRFLPYSSILPAFSAINSKISQLPGEQQLQARRKFNHWYWASVFMNRYSSAVETKSTRDYLDVNRWFVDDVALPSVVNDFNEQFRRLDLEAETRNAGSIYRAVFNLFVIGGARDWVTGAVPQPDEIDDHHIVPASWGKANGLERLIDTILNRAPLTAETNRNWISDRLPNEYLPKLVEASGENAVRANLETHFVSPAAFDILLRTPFTPSDYQEFIAERKRTILSAIENLLVKERLDLSPSLRELDRQIEETELALRRMAIEALQSNGLGIPDHLLPKVRDRMESDRRKGLLNEELAGSLTGQMQYLDLRELEATIVAKAAWPAFENTFTSKEQLAARFGQLAELRNGLRHSRSVSQIAEKDGQAALLWFRQKLGRQLSPSTHQVAPSSVAQSQLLPAEACTYLESGDQGASV